MARTKVLLVQDVLDLGEAGDVRVVAGGYARNYLMPRGLAILATRGALKQAEEIRQAGMRRRARERAHAESQAALVRGQRLLFGARAGENERLYGSVTAHEIADQLSEAVGFEVDRRRIQLEHPLRDLGIYTLELRFMADVSAAFQVAVVREGETWMAAEAREAAKAKARAEKEAEDAAARAVAEAEETAQEEAAAEEAEEEEE